MKPLYWNRYSLINRWRRVRERNEGIILIKRACFALSVSWGCCCITFGSLVSQPTEILSRHTLPSQLAFFFSYTKQSDMQTNTLNSSRLSFSAKNFSKLRVRAEGNLWNSDRSVRENGYLFFEYLKFCNWSDYFLGLLFKFSSTP